MYLSCAINDYKKNTIPPPGGPLFRIGESNDDYEKKKQSYKRILFAFEWELPNALYYIRTMSDRKKRMHYYGHNPYNSTIDVNDYLQCLEDGYNERKEYHKWSKLEKTIQICPYISGNTKESLLYKLRKDNEDYVLRCFWETIYGNMDNEERLKYDTLLC